MDIRFKTKSKTGCIVLTDPETNCSGDNDIPSAAEKERNSSKMDPPSENCSQPKYGLGRWLVFQCGTNKNDVFCLCVLCVVYIVCFVFRKLDNDELFLCVWAKVVVVVNLCIGEPPPKIVFVERSLMFIFRHKTFRFFNQKQKNCVVIRGAIYFVTFSVARLPIASIPPNHSILLFRIANVSNSKN